ncbi:MAG: DUF721 domain-containing protein [Thermoleophilia bacterium]
MSSRDRWRLPGRLDGELAQELGRLGVPTESGDLGRLWAEAVGPQIARNAWPARVARDGTLVVHTRSSVWAQELAHLEPVVRERLGASAPPRLRFVVGAVPEPSPAQLEDVVDAPTRPSAEHRERAASLAAGIEDEALREAVARLAAHVLARSAPTDPSGTL